MMVPWCLQDLVQCLKAYAAQLHVCAQHGAAEHDMMREDVENAALHGGLEITRGGGKITQDDDEDVIKRVSGLHADGLWCRRVMKNKDEM